LRRGARAGAVLHLRHALPGPRAHPRRGRDAADRAGVAMRRHALSLALVAFARCTPTLTHAARAPDRDVPGSYNGAPGAARPAKVVWRDFFDDPKLAALIDTALAHNQELALVALELDIGGFEVDARKGEYWPRVGA